MQANQIIEGIKTQAQNESWSRKQVRKALYATDNDEVWSLRDEVLVSMGYEETGVAAAREQAEADREQAARAAQYAAARAAREAAEQAAAADLAAYRVYEKQLLTAVEPDWASYHDVLRLIADEREYRDAARHGDVGDMMAYKNSHESIEELIYDAELDDRSVAAEIIRKTKFRMTEKQGKLVALVISKLISLHD